MINYGILCTASIVGRYIQGIKNSKDGYAYGIASRDLQKAREAAQEYGIEHYYGSYEDLIKDENIDVVYIPTMNTLHYENARLALSCHKHVVIEKPFVLNTQDAIDLFRIARENNCFLMEAQKCVFLPTSIKCKELLRENAIGTVKYIETRQGSKNRFNPGHWMDYYEMGGGAWHGSAAYPIELFQYLFDEPEITGQASFIQGDYTADAIVSAQLKFNHILAVCMVGMNVPTQNEAVFYGTDGKIVIPDFWKADRLLLYRNGKEEIFEYKVPCEFVYQIDHINSCLQQGLLESPVMNKEKTIGMVQLMSDLYRSYKPE